MNHFKSSGKGEKDDPRKLKLKIKRGGRILYTSGNERGN